MAVRSTYTNISIADLSVRGKLSIDLDTRLFHEAMSPGTGSVLSSQVGIRYVYVQVYGNDTHVLKAQYPVNNVFK